MMQIKEFDVIIDIKDLKKVKYRDPISKKAIQEITVIREDNFGNQLNIYLEDGEKPYLIGDSKVQIVFKKHDKTTVEMSRESGDFEVVDNVIKCVLSTNVIAIAGRQVQAEAIVSDINGRQVTSAKFYFRVARGLLTDDMVKSTNEFSTLDRLIGNVQELEDTVLVNINDVNSTLNTTIADASTSKTDLDNSIGDANSSKSNLDESISTATTKKTQLDSSVNTADTSKSNLDTAITSANNSKSSLDISVENAITGKSNLDSSIFSGNTLKSNLDGSISAGATLKSDLDTNIVAGNQLKIDLPPLVDSANTAKTSLDESVSTSIAKKSDLDGSIDLATTKDDDLKTTVDDANEIKTSLDSSIDTANTIKTNLDQSIADGDIDTINDKIGVLSGMPTTEKSNLAGAIGEVKNELTSHKEDYTNQRQQDQLKVATVEKGLNDYKSTLANVNVNQEVKQKVTGYGTINLPKNTANGQVSSSINGETRINYVKNSNMNIDINTNGVADDWVLTDVANGARNTIVSSIDGGQKMEVTQNSASGNAVNHYIQIVPINGMVGEKVSARFQYKYQTVVGTSLLANYRLDFVDANNSVISTITNSDITVLTNAFLSIMHENLTVPIGAVSVKFSLGARTTSSAIINDRSIIWFRDIQLEKTDSFLNKNYISTGTRSTVSASRLKSESTDKTQKSLMYLPNVGELRSVPNGTKDEIRVSGGNGEHVKRNNKKVLQSSDIVSINTSFTGGVVAHSKANIVSDAVAFSSAIKQGIATVTGMFELSADRVDVYNSSSNVGGFKTANGQTLTFLLPIGTTLAQAQQQLTGLELTYQLAQEIVTPIQTSGNLISYPSGTVYIENVVADAGIYTTKFDIKELQLPIKSIDKLIKYNFTTGVQTVLDTSLAVINADKKSFTHPNLAKGDMVFVDYYYDVESTLGETTIEYLDSRHTIKDTTNSKFYSWDIKSTNGVPTVSLTEVL